MLRTYVKDYTYPKDLQSLKSPGVHRDLLASTLQQDRKRPEEHHHDAAKKDAPLDKLQTSTAKHSFADQQTELP
eukprot:m.89996 g.89996  ORF g.89996 m.89996 type:complete len:74 (+) comp36636_c0_seq3:69-290(+)